MAQEQLKATPEVQVLLEKARQASLSRKMDQAAALYEQALARARERDDRMGVARALASLGSVYLGMGQPQKALDLYSQALPLFREIGDKRREIGVLTSLGTVYLNTGQLQKALEVYNRALPLCREVGDKRGEANTLINTGIVYDAFGRSQDALDLYNRALPLFREVGDKRGEASTLTNMGMAYDSIGQLQKALEFYNKALPLHRETGNKQFEANTLTNIGIAYDSFGQPQRALEFYSQALPLFQETGDKRGEATAISSIGTAYGVLGQPRKALEFNHKALPLLQGMGDKSGEAGVLNNIGAAYHKIGQPQKALEFNNRALAILRETGERRGEATVLASIGNAYTLLKQPQKALAVYGKSLVLFQDMGDKKGEADTFSLQAQVHESLHHPDEAEAHYARAIALYESLRENLGGLSEAKSSFLGATLPVYYAYLNLLLRRGKTAAAFEIAQKTKARSLLDHMAAGRVDLSGELTPEERAQELELRQRADLLNAQMVKEGVQNEPGAKKRHAALKAELAKTESQFQTLTDTLYSRHPGLAAKRIARTATYLEAIKLLPADTALLDYIVVAKDRLALFVTVGRRIHAFTLPLDYPRMILQATLFRSACADPRRDYRKAAREFYQRLVSPAAKHLEGVKRLVVCPDGALWDVSFAALLSDGRFLAQRYEIAYAYSATGAVAALTAQTSRTKQTGTLLALANPDFGSSKRFGDLEDVPGQRPFDSPSRPIDSPSRPIDSPSRPIDSPSRPIDSPSRPIDSPSRPIDSPSRPIDSPSRPLDSPSRPLDSPSRAFDAVSRGGAIVSLPGTQREADALRRLFPAATVLTGKAAQESAARQTASGYRYLHFATHGVFNDASPMLSSLVLAQPSPGSKDDGFLTAREIFEMDLSAEMAVLSACNTARGVQRTGDGIIGLTWALFAAGCPTQVVSQWAVDDASTATLMQRFYGNLTQKKLGKGAALRQASLSLMNDPKHRHPYYWAPFVLVGDWR